MNTHRRTKEDEYTRNIFITLSSTSPIIFHSNPWAICIYLFIIFFFFFN